MIEYTIARDTADVAGFTSLYQEAFGGPPYFEVYPRYRIHKEIWGPHLERGVIVLAKDDGSVVGFCCALPVDDAPDDIREFLQDSQEILADSDQMWYISELGVALSHRGRKIAYAVTERCLSEANRLGGAYYVMRTAAKGSNSRHMFLRMGSTEISEVQDVSAQTEENHSQSTQRIWLYGNCNFALQNLKALSAS